MQEKRACLNTASTPQTPFYTYGRNPRLKKRTLRSSQKQLTRLLKKPGGLAGLIIAAPSFPGWKSLGAMAKHFCFVQDHHKYITKVGLVTDSVLGNVAEHLASHFVSAEIKHFPAGQCEAATQWILNRD
jgi:hypothetical protein